MLSKFSILQRGLALILLPLLFQAVFAGFLLWRLAYRNDVENWAIHTKEVIAQAETVFRVLVEADSHLNAFAVINDDRMGASFEHSLVELPRQVITLGGLVSDNPAQVRRLEAIAVKTSGATVEMRALYRLARSSDPTTIHDRLRDYADENLSANIRRDLDGFIGEEEKLDRARLAELRRTQTRQFSMLVNGMVASLLIGALCAWLFGRTIVRRLAILNENVRRIRTGQTLVPRVSGTDEITALDNSFHLMAEDLARAAVKEKEFQENLERRASELTILNRELTQKSEENEMFVYSVSHDLRSPLVNLQGFSKELTLAMGEMREVFAADNVPARAKEQGEDILKHGMAEPVTFIQTAVTRLSAIIDALLRLSRAGRVEYQRVEIDTAAVTGRVIDAMRSVMAAKKARVSVVTPMPRVWGDPTAVEQIFANLVGNALNYLDKNRPGVIEVGGAPHETDPSLVTCYVKDNGLGIPEAYVGKIFGIFQRLHGNIAVGEGIGLALVRRMVERHGGRIWVESTEGVGSTFFVALPKVEDAPPLVTTVEAGA